MDHLGYSISIVHGWHNKVEMRVMMLIYKDTKLSDFAGANVGRYSSTSGSVSGMNQPVVKINGKMLNEEILNQ